MDCPRVNEILLRPDIDIDLLGAELDGLEAPDRVLAVRAMGRKVQARLFEAARKRAQDVSLDFLVPPDWPPGKTAVFKGKNSLPLFTHFEKRFCRLPGITDRLAGYNHQSLSFFTGPGYFHARLEDGAIHFDYRDPPPEGGPGWPRFKPNEKGLSRFVYKNMVDICHPIGRHTLIGAAYDGPTMAFKGQTFLLSRE